MPPIFSADFEKCIYCALYCLDCWSFKIIHYRWIRCQSFFSAND